MGKDSGNTHAPVGNMSGNTHTRKVIHSEDGWGRAKLARFRRSGDKSLARLGNYPHMFRTKERICNESANTHSLSGFTHTRIGIYTQG